MRGEHLKRLLLWLALTAAAVCLGFAVAWVVLAAATALLPPFRFPDDDDSLREFGPVLLAYGSWAMTSLLGTILAWRWVRRRF